MDHVILFCLFDSSMPKLKYVSWAIDNGLGPPPDAIPCSDDLLLVFDRSFICSTLFLIYDLSLIPW